MRWRVRTGYPVAVIYWLLAAPSPLSILGGAIIAAFGLIIRGAASGHLRKYEQLCTTGPYARSRNPLYLGSAVLAAAFMVAGRSWWGGALVAVYFAVFYYAVMRNEESDLRARYGQAFEEYAARVPLFFPGVGPFTPAPAANAAAAPGAPAPGAAKTFSWAQYQRNREYRALAGTLAGIGVVWLRMWLRARWGH